MEQFGPEHGRVVLNRIQRLGENYQCSAVDFKVEDQYGLDCIWRIVEDHKENTWLATQEVGVVLFDKETNECQKFTHDAKNPNSIRGNMVISMMVDRKNRLFAGTYLGLDVADLNEFDETGEMKFVHFPEFNSVNGCRINHIYEDRKGNVWVSTDGNGLSIFNAQLDHCTTYTKADGLRSDVVLSVVEEKHGTIWVTTQGGITKVNVDRNEWTTFDESKGLFLNEFRRGSILLTEAGELFVGSVNGAVSLPTESSNKVTSPKVYLNQITIGNRQIKVGAEINGRVLLPTVLSEMKSISFLNKENTFNISFASLDFVSNAINYYYQLEGFDASWKFLENDHSITFQDLRAGTYLLKVRSGISAIDDDVPITTLQIIVKQSFFKSPIFYASILLLLGLTIWFFYQFFKRKFERLKEAFQTMGSNKGKYTTSKLTKPMITDIQLKLEQYMRESKPYLQHDLKQSDVAQALEVTIHELSQVLNQNLNTTFRDYLNKFRIDEFIQKMKVADLSKFTIMAIAEQCGFQSKSSFYRSFNKVTGKTPAEFFKELN